jgi:polyisoprenoid-binding protein YceI
MTKSIGLKASGIAAALLLAPLAACAPLQTAIALAQETSSDITRAPAGAYKLDASHTAVVWRVQHMGVSMYTARFDKVEGGLTLNPADPTKSALTVSIDTASVSTGLRNAQGELAFDKKIAEALGAPAHAAITFRSTALTRTSPTTGTITGDLTLNGVTKPVTLNATFGGGRVHPFAQHYLLGFSATAQFKRSDFGVTSWAGGVGDVVQVQIDAEFIHQP